MLHLKSVDQSRDYVAYVKGTEEDHDTVVPDFDSIDALNAHRKANPEHWMKTVCTHTQPKATLFFAPDPGEEERLAGLDHDIFWNPPDDADFFETEADYDKFYDEANGTSTATE